MPTENSKNIGSPDLSRIIERLLEAEIEFILVGGLAAVIQGAPVTTMDVDILYKRSPENALKLFSFLQSIHAIYRRPDDKIIVPKKEDFYGMGHGLFSTTLGPIDVLGFIEQGCIYEDLLDHSVAIQFRAHTVRVLDIEKIIELKRASKDPKDKRRLPVLEETLRELKKTKRNEGKENP